MEIFKKGDANANLKVGNTNTYKIKLLAILLNIISFNLSKAQTHFEKKVQFLFQNMLQVLLSTIIFIYFSLGKPF